MPCRLRYGVPRYFDGVQPPFFTSTTTSGLQSPSLPPLTPFCSTWKKTRHWSGELANLYILPQTTLVPTRLQSYILPLHPSPNRRGGERSFAPPHPLPPSLSPLPTCSLRPVCKSHGTAHPWIEILNHSSCTPLCVEVKLNVLM